MDRYLCLPMPMKKHCKRLSKQKEHIFGADPGVSSGKKGKSPEISKRLRTYTSIAIEILYLLPSNKKESPVIQAIEHVSSQIFT